MKGTVRLSERRERGTGYSETDSVRDGRGGEGYSERDSVRDGRGCNGFSSFDFALRDLVQDAPFTHLRKP